jgi:putative transcriptional regulator
MPIVKFTLDPSNPPKMTAEESARFASMTDAEIEENAKSDPDNPPITDEEFRRAASASLVKSVRAATGLSQVAFAKRFRINAARLRDLERGRTTADSALAAYLTVIAREPDAVSRALKAS